MTTLWHFNALQRWSHQSLSNAFALRAAAIAIGSSLVVAAISLAVIFLVEQASLHAQLQEKARHVAERIEYSVDIVEGAVADLAGSSMFMTALLDSPGRNAYVVPFLENYRFPIAAASGLALCDLNGERLAGTRSTQSQCRANSPLFKQVIAQGKRLRELVPLKNGHLGWVIYQGVVFPYTGTIEGVVVTELDLVDILSSLPKDFDLEGVALVRGGSAEYLVNIGASNTVAPALESERALLFKDEAGATPFLIEAVATDELKPFGSKLLPLATHYGLGSLILVLAVVYWARKASRTAIQPLIELTDIAQHIARSGDLRIAVPNFEANEVGQLANAFAMMVDTLQLSEESLERKVAHRTAALVKSEAVAEAANLAKSQFLANMSHEIRTPMNAILGMLHLLGATDLNARQADYARKAESAAKSLLGLLNDILDYSKIEAGKMELDPEPFSVERLLRDLAVIVSSNLGKKAVEVLFDLDPTLPSQLVGDSMRILQILINLSGNAVKFTERGEIIIQIKVVQQTAQSATLRIAVKDSGIGISPENQKRLFSDFSQAEASTTRRFGGTGLGLSICKRLVNLMGGDLLIDSAVGQGSTFHFQIQLPVVQNTSEELLKLTSAQVQSMRVLVVDDNAMARDLIAVMALSLGWQVDVAQGGAEALSLVQQAGNEYQAIFMDWDMPGMDGWETIERVSAALYGKAAPITVMVTASGREALSNRSAQEQAQLNAFLVKPITASMLREVVTDAREGRSNLRLKAREGKSQPKRLNGMRVLVVEDNPINQQVARELLIAEGALVEIADNGLLGVSAVSQAQANKGTHFDAVLMDLQMPVMDGFDATRAIRLGLGLTDLPIVAMTANAMASDREACLSVGMNEHVGKPFDLNHLVAVLLNVSGYHATKNSQESASRDEAMTPSSSSLIDTGIDVDTALARMSGMRTLYTGLVGDFVKALDGAAQEFDRLLAIPSLLDASRHAHTLKGTASTLGATQLARFASELEKLCKTEADSGVILKQSPALAEVVRSTQASLRQVLELMLSPSAEPVVTANQRLDKASPAEVNAARQAIEELAGLLKNADLAALQRLAELREVLAAVVPEALGTLEGAMQGLEFENAQKICRKIADSLDPAISQS